MRDYLVVCAVAFAISAFAVKAVLNFALRTGHVYQPNERTVHTTPLPDLGGVGMYLAFVITLGTASFLPTFRDALDSTELLAVLLCTGIAFATGLIDDVKPMSPPAKIAGLALAGATLSLLGVSIIFFRIPFFDLLVLSPDLSAFVTVIWVIGMANVINLIDGLDGLAAGIVAIASAAFLIYSLRLESSGIIERGSLGPLVAATLIGVCLGFLIFNKHPAKIIMGDGGALFLGAALGSATIAVGGNSDDPFSGQSWFFFAPMVVPLLILGIPVLDVAWSIVRRIATRSSWSTADRKHLHHRLVELGHGHGRAVVILWLWTAVLSALVLVPVVTGRGDGIVPVALVGAALAGYTAFGPWFDSVTERQRGRDRLGPDRGNADGGSLWAAAQAASRADSLGREDRPGDMASSAGADASAGARAGADAADRDASAARGQDPGAHSKDISGPL